MNFFISDTHFGHDNIIGYDGRPFKTTDEMDRELTRRWNDRVCDNDDVYILGDLVWTKDRVRAAEVVASLNGRKHLILGNHDQVFTKHRKFFMETESLIDEMTEYKELDMSVPGILIKIILCHYPMPFYKNMFHGWYHFYGHVHNSPEQDCCEKLRVSTSDYYKQNTLMLNVGCMMPYMDYGPRSFAALDDHLKSTSTYRKED